MTLSWQIQVSDPRGYTAAAKRWNTANIGQLCILAWQAMQRVIKFSSESFPKWLRNFLWWTSRFDMAPHD